MSCVSTVQLFTVVVAGKVRLWRDAYAAREWNASIVTEDSHPLTYISSRTGLNLTPWFVSDFHRIPKLTQLVLSG
jgi:hypothetical protein